MSKVTKNILFITNLHLWSLEAGKGGKAFYHTVSTYINGGWNVHLVSTGGSIPEDISSKATVFEENLSKLAELQESGTKFISVFARFYKMRLMNKFFIRTSSKILNELDKSKTIVYAYEVEAVYAAKKIASRFKIPLVTRFQGTILSNVPDNWKNSIRRSPHFSALRTTSDLVIMTNDGTQGDQTLSRLRNKSANIKFWRNGVDGLDKFNDVDYNSLKGSLNLPHDSFVFITVSRLIGWKRVDLAIHGFSKVADKYPNTYLIVVGDGPEKENLERLTTSLDLLKRVVFTGSVPQAEVKSFLRCSNVFLSFYDLSNLGNPIMEAMIAGLPLITIDVGDTGKLIQNGGNGVLIAANQLDEIPKHLELIIVSKELREHISRGALATARKEFWSWDERMQMEENLVFSLLKK
jgi:glycosyltransferase involved in cell wall biosynthesis